MAAWLDDLDGANKELLASHCAGVKASTVAARPLVAVAAAPIWALRSLSSGSSVACLAGVTRACALAAAALRLGMALAVAWSDGQNQKDKASRGLGL